MAGSFPTSGAELDAEALTRLLRSQHPGVTVTGVEVESVHEFGEGDVSTAGRATLVIDHDGGADLPKRMVVKVARPDLPATALYENEVAVYEHLRGELDIETPRCFGTVFDPATGTFGLALEDLGVRGARFGDVELEVPLDSIRSVLAQAARLHGTYWEGARLHDDLSWLQAHTSGDLHLLFSHPDLAPALIREQVATVQFKAEILSSVGQELADLVAQTRVVQSHQARLPNTLLHGDMHVGNTYYLPDGTGGLIDWQLSARGHFMHDVAYYLVTSQPAQRRRDSEAGLLGFYLERLAEAGVDAPSFDEAWAEYRRAVAWCLYIGWLTTPIENYGWSINVVNHLRIATAYRDLDTAAAVAEVEDAAT